ncbi:MAG TPA: response regulator [Candidatus Acidoferrum sp.]|nr:response regulator [Candidatus Acidoferrum sp.]
MSRLVVITEGLTGLSHELGAHWVTIGRGDNNNFQIVETSISSQHCEVLLHGNELVVRDLRSTNGTFVGGKMITEAVLTPGQSLRVGQVELRLEISDPAAAATRKQPLAPTEGSPPAAGPVRVGHKTYRVLFVDDSMAFLEMITDLFGGRAAEGWEIHTAPSADKALAILQQKLIDMVVLDIGMPLLDGAQLLGIIHQRYPNIKKVVLTGAIDDSRRATCLANGAELFLVKPGTDDGWTLIFNMLTSLVRWEDHDAYSGVLGEIGLPSIIQMECMEGKSSILEVRNPQTSGEVYIESGNIIHAETGKLIGAKALHQLLALNTGEFRLIPFREPPQRSLQGPWDALLAEAARLQEEEKPAGDEDETILITRKKPPAQPPPAIPPAPAPEAKTPPAQPAQPAATPEVKASPPKPAPTKPAKPPPPRFSSGMNFVTLEEIIEADTAVVPAPDKNGQPPGDSKQAPEKK